MKTALFLITLFFATFSACADTQFTATISVLEEHEKHLKTSTSYALSWELFNFAARSAGIQLYPVESSWQESFQGVKNHAIDFVFAAKKTTKREQWAMFSLPLISDGYGLFTKTENPVEKISDIDFEHGAVAVFTQSTLEKTKLAKKLGFAQLYSVAHRPQMYDMLQADRIQYLFINGAFTNYYCTFYSDTPRGDCLKLVGPLYDKNNLHILADKKNAEALRKLALIDSQLNVIKGTKQVAAIFQKYGKSEAEHTEWQSRLAQLISL